jgi:hypothetical protein|tara:strand:+ start:49 stop:327 length:279 start_codon:yes stop_codon:yes gene_type:complete
MRYDEFSSQLRTECGLTSAKLDIHYNESDHRCWTALIGRDTANVFVTFNVNRGDRGIKNYDILGDGRQLVEVHPSDIFEILSDILPPEEASE